MKPIVISNSKVPVFLSHFSPIEIYAITLWPFIFCREEIDSKTLNHETIHIEQYTETLVIGFLLIYLFDFCWALLKYHGQESEFSLGERAYHSLRAEQEAYEFDQDLEYLQRRKRYEWLSKYKV